HIFVLMSRPTISTLFPYTTLFRSLERVLKNTREKYNGALIVADGVFSMSGDILNLPRVVELAQEYGCKVYCDDAHALGVLGPKRSEEHTSELQSRENLVCRLLLEK